MTHQDRLILHVESPSSYYSSFSIPYDDAVHKQNSVIEWVNSWTTFSTTFKKFLF